MSHFLSQQLGNTYRTKGPIRLCIVNLEFAVGGHPFRLNRTGLTQSVVSGRFEQGAWALPEIRPSDFGAGIAVGHVDGPDAGARADVKDAVGRVQGRQMMLVVHQLQQNLVVQVQAVLLLLVRRHGVLVDAEMRVISTAWEIYYHLPRWMEKKKKLKQEKMEARKNGSKKKYEMEKNENEN